MEKLECIIVHGSMPIVSSLAFLSLATMTICKYCFSDVRDGEIVRKRGGLLQTCQHVVGRTMIREHVYVTQLHSSGLSETCNCSLFN